MVNQPTKKLKMYLGNGARSAMKKNINKMLRCVTCQFRQAFIAVERGYLDSIGDLLAERASMQFDIPDGLNSYETYQKFPHLVRVKCTN